MKKESLKNAILYFASKYDYYDSYKYLIDTHQPFPKLVNMIVYQMFIKKFDWCDCPLDDYEQYKILFEYATKLEENGYYNLDS